MKSLLSSKFVLAETCNKLNIENKEDKPLLLFLDPLAFNFHNG